MKDKKNNPDNANSEGTDPVDPGDAENQVSPDKPDTIIRVVANRTFDQSLRGEEYQVDIKEQYWADQLTAGNISIMEGE